MMRLCAQRGIASVTRRRPRPPYIRHDLIFSSRLPYQLSSPRFLSSNDASTNNDRNRRNNSNNSNNNNRSQNRRNNDNGDQRHRSKRGNAKVMIRDMEDQVNHFRQRLHRLPPIPDPLSEGGNKGSTDIGYQALVQDARDFVEQLQQAVEQGQLDTRFTREVSFILGQALLFFRTSFSDCQKVLALAKKWNLNIPNQQPALEAACSEERWQEASDLFSREIDPDYQGYAPMEISVKKPLGLYAIARDAQARGSPVAEQVMDAVMKMSMVNPTDQNNYVFAAGAALGRAGAWKELIDYQESSYNSSRLGQPLIGATMHACVVNDRSEEALKQFAKLTDGPASVGSEWQWGGGSDVVDPIVRDMAMRAGGSQSLGLYRQATEEGFQVSAQALLSVVSACEDPSDVLAIMSRLCDSTEWLVDGDDLRIVHVDEQEWAVTLPVELIEPIVLQTMRHSNHARRFGNSLLSYQMLIRSHDQLHEDWQRDFIDRLSISGYPDQNLSAIMTALCGLRCLKVARTLFEAVTDGNQSSFPFSFDIYQDAKANTSIFDEAWISAHTLMKRVTDVVTNLPEESLTPSQTEVLLAALAKAMRACNGVDPEASIFFSRHVAKHILRRQKVKASMKGAVRSFLGIEEEEEPDYTLLAKSDSLLAETLRAYRLSGFPEQSLSLLETVLETSKQDYESMPLSVEQALQALIDQGLSQDAMELFQSLTRSVWTPGMFVSLSQALEKEQRWDSISDIYHLALKSGCLTEELGIITMRAIVETPHVEGKIRVLRGIIGEMCSLTGLVENEWQYKRYWKLKKNLGLRYSRLIMWWNDERTSDVFELQLAIDQFTERKSAGLNPRNDVLRSIVRHCQHFERLTRIIKKLEMPLPAEKELWADLIMAVVAEMQSSSLRNNKRFIEEVAMALLTVGAHAALEEFISEAATRGVRVNRPLLHS